MTSPQLLVHNALIVNEGERFRGYVAADGDGLIAEVGRGDAPAELMAVCQSVTDAQGALLLPGAIDTHVHFREPGLTHKGSIATESLAALSGGVTSVIEMPNTVPQTVDLASWQWKMDRAADTCRVNYAFYLGATADNLDELRRADYSRVAAVKLFLGSSTGNMLLNDPNKIGELMRCVPALIAVHAESEPLIAAARDWAKARFAGSEVPVAMHSVIRSRRACYEATRQIVELAKANDARLHVLHISTADELVLFTPGPAETKTVTAETCPNYLLHTCLDYPRMGAAVKCNPAVKLPSDRDALRRAVADDLIDTIATDHAPHTEADKRGDALTAASGIASIATSLSSMLDLAREGWFTVEKLVEKMAHNPATIYRIERRGFLRPGYYADLTLIDDTKGARPRAVFVNGRLAYTPSDGDLGAKPMPLRFDVS